MAAGRLGFSGETAIVTGAAAGIGRACGRAFAAEGARVVLVDIDAARNVAAAADIAAETGAETLALTADIAVEDDCARVAEEARTRFGRIDVLVNNAGIVKAGGVLDLAPADFDRVLAVNLRGAFMLTQRVARVMVADGTKGAVVNISSVNDRLAIPGQLAYVVSKGGLSQLTKVCALGLAEHGIRVNAIGPGSVMSDLLKTVVADDAARRAILARTPLGRVGEPEEIAAIALFLASPMASYVTGETIYADGGRLALNYTVPVRE